MLNIQIRGSLIDIKLTSISKYNYDNLSSGKYSASYIKTFINNSSDCNTVYRNTLPIVEQNSELQVTSFENENYYDDGYTFLRKSLTEINSKYVTLKISSGIQDRKYLNIILQYGYGSAFETELMDLNFRNFENNQLQYESTVFFGGVNEIITSVKLNHLGLGDLNRSKYDIVSEKILFLKKNHNDGVIDLSKSLNDQGVVKVLDDDDL